MKRHVIAASLMLAAAGYVVNAPGCWAQATSASPVSPAALHPLTLLNGWTPSPFSTNPPSAELINGVVRFRGAMATSGSGANPFVLPSSFRPLTDVYVPVDLCNAANGRLYIQPNGDVTVEAQNNFADAQCHIA